MEIFLSGPTISGNNIQKNEIHNIVFVKNRNSQTILNTLDSIFNFYNNRGFTVQTLLVYREFESLIDELTKRDIVLNTTSASEHVPDIERRIRVIKEIIIGLYNNLLFYSIPKLMIRELVYYIVT